VAQALGVVRSGLRRYLSDLRASRKFVAGEVSHAGWLDLGRFRWRNVSPGQAARTAIGVMVPLVIGVLTGHPEYGTFAALGALPTGFVAFRGITRTRVVLVVLTTAGMAVSTFIGAAAAAGAPWLLIPVVMAWAYLAGVCAALGPSAIAVSLQWPVALLIASAIPLSLPEAGVRAGLVLAGGLWQGVLVVSSWALHRGSTERTAMAESYTILGQYAAQLAAGQDGPPPPATLPGSHALRDPNPLLRGGSRQHLIDLREEAERIRATLTVLGAGTGDGSTAGSAGGARPAAAGSSPADGGTAAPDSSPAPDGRPAARGAASGRVALLASAARALGETGQALSARPGQRPGHLDIARQVIADSEAGSGHAWSWAGHALHGQLRSAARITERFNDAEPGRAGRDRAGHEESGRGGAGREGARRDGAANHGPAGRGSVVPPRPPLRLPARDLMVTLRASVGTSSEAGRHALRLAAVAGLAQVIALAGGLPHGYWVTLTVLIVLRPDYGSTVYRGLQRAAGTVLGAGLGVATVLLGHFGNGALLTGIGVSMFAAYAVFPVNYLFYSVFLTDFVVVLLALAGLPADQTALDRLAGTAIGTALALAAYILWPTWEQASASDKFARMISTQSRFAATMLHSYPSPASDELRQARTLKLAARRARIDAEASADRLADEPDRPPVTRAFAQALVSVGHRLALAGLALEAAVNAHHVELRRASPAIPPGPGPAAASPPPGGVPGPGPGLDRDPVPGLLDQLAGMVRQSAAQLAESLHRLGPPGPLPPLRAVQEQLPRDDGDGALFAVTDGLVDSLNTSADILRRHLSRPGHGEAGDP
jgi:uncharacterized membrane protein YccC